MCTPAAADLFAAAVPFIIAGAGTAGPTLHRRYKQGLVKMVNAPELFNDPSVFYFCAFFSAGVVRPERARGGAPLSRSGRRNSVCRRFVEDGPAAPCFLHRQNV